ncbi:hypothetical protein P7H16_26755 [Paenibacillus larvae]|nr:hypothetical protein [Paenibacillus larvae]MDT2249817.1 hypothetical protein [Paenibacillus larvae]
MKTKAFIVDAREFKIGFCKGGVWTSLPMPDDELTSSWSVYERWKYSIR